MRRIFVGNLAWATTDSDLRRAFEPFGAVHFVRIVVDRETSRSRGFGFVEMDEGGGARAIEALHGSNLGGRAIVVNEARPRSDGAVQPREAHIATSVASQYRARRPGGSRAAGRDWED